MLHCMYLAQMNMNVRIEIHLVQHSNCDRHEHFSEHEKNKFDPFLCTRLEHPTNTQKQTAD